MSKKIKPSIFQVLLLNNKSQDVEVQESEQVDFSQVKATSKKRRISFHHKQEYPKNIFPQN